MDPSSRSPRAIAPSTAPSPRSSSDDHPSHMRKRPRLDDASPLTSSNPDPSPPNTVTGCPASDSSDTVVASPDLSTAQTPAPTKIILDLRKNKSNPVPSPASPTLLSTSATAGDGARDLGQRASALGFDNSPPTRYMDVTAATSPSDDNDPPPIDITLDDIHDGADAHHDSSSTPFDSFAEAFKSRSPEAAMQQLLDQTAGSRSIAHDDLRKLHNWFDDRLAACASRPASWQHLHPPRPEFWFKLANFFARFMTKKSLNFAISKYLRNDPSQLIGDTLALYARICVQLLAADLHSINTSADPTLLTDPLPNSRHLRNLHSIFRARDDAGIWHFVWTKFRVNSRSLRLQVAEELLTDSSAPALHIIHLASALSANLNTFPLLRHWLICAMEFSFDLLDHCRQLRDANNVSDVDRADHALRKATGTAVADIAHGVIATIETHKPDLPGHFYAEALTSLRQLMYETSFLDANHDITLADSIYVQPRQVTLALGLYWAAATKGRMELRVWGIQLLSDSLVKLWTLNTEEPSTFRASVDCAVAFLAQNRVIEYLVGPDSHPELISRSANILAYAMITHTWSDQMTAAVLNTIHTGQNTRLVSSVIYTLPFCLRHATPSVRTAFCVGISQLPSSALSEDLIDIVALSLDPLSRESLQPAQTSALYDCLVDMLTKLSDSSVVSSPHGDLLVHKGYENLRKFDRELDDTLKRKAVYEECIADVSEGSATSLGSINALGALWAGRCDEIADLLRNTTIIQHLCESVMAYTREHKLADETGAAVSYEFRVRFQTLLGLFLQSADYRVSPPAGTEIWDHLLGAEAIGDFYRDFAWGQLAQVCHLQREPHSLIETLLDTLLPSISPLNYTLGTVTFVDAAARYSLRVHETATTHDIIAIPSAAMFWKMILQIPRSRSNVADSAIVSFTAVHADLKLHDQYPLSSISNTHAALVEECLKYLSDAAAEIRATPSPRVANAAALLKFERIVNFLKHFLDVVRPRLDYELPGPVPPSPSPKVTGDPNGGDDTRTLRLELYDNGSQGQPFEMRIASTKTFQDLRDSLLRRLQRSDMRLFSRGSELDLSNQSARTIADIPEDALILVKTLSNIPDKVSIDAKGNNMNTAESTVLAHFGELYQYLKLDGQAEACVSALLQHFEYPSFAVDSILSGTATEDLLLSNEKPYKTVYELRSICHTLEKMRGDSEENGKMVLCSTDFLLNVLTGKDDAFLAVDSPASDWVTNSYLATLLTCLRLCEKQEVALPFAGKQRAIVDKLFDLLESFSHEKTAIHAFASDSAALSYELLSYIISRNLECWRCFASNAALKRTHSWLLLESGRPQLSDRIRSLIQSLVQPNTGISVELLVDVRLCFWNLLAPLVEKIIEPGTTAPHFFQLMTAAIIPSLKDMQATRIDAGTHLKRWSDLLIGIRSATALPLDAIEFIASGLSCLLRTSLNTGLMTVGDVAANKGLAIRIFEDVLFPDIDDESLTLAEDPRPRHQIISADTRTSLFKLALDLCQDPASTCALVDRGGFLTARHVEDGGLSFNTDCDWIMRSPAGFVGLSNLTNTCYMNSLLAQLFMNVGFRNFVLGAETRQGGTAHHLLDATKRLFTFMGCSKRRFADTTPFTLAVVPYDAPQIDVSIQMDVDEFCNLLFDRWEGEMDTPKLKSQFRSIYGGEMITQIKSLHCDHVSERTEPYMALSCEVKGKLSLQSSLQAYIEGDTMEGENKYKCESCGGKFVDAVKRSCLKTIPDSLMFHLKRFDFDLVSLQRNKINDRFDFPMVIDMTPFKYSTVNGSDPAEEPDYFDLVGVLIHNGTAEAGHYYSYIKDPRDPSGGRWLEFNDTEVTSFGVEKLATSSFGGCSAGDGSSTRFSKLYNAYMLFYNRRSSAGQDGASDPTNLDGLAVEDDMKMLKRDIVREDALAARWHCLLDKSCAFFVGEAMKKLKQVHNGSCSNDHSAEKSAIELALDYLHQVAIRYKDESLLEQTLPSFEQSATSCPQCCELSAAWLIENPTALEDFLLQCPFSDMRARMVAFVFRVITALREQSSRYGVNTDACRASEVKFDPRGLLCRLLGALVSVGRDIGAYAYHWENYFFLLHSIATLGLGERRALLHLGAFRHAIEVLFMQEPPAKILSRFYRENQAQIARMKRLPEYAPVGEFVAAFLDHMDCWAPASPSDASRSAQSKFSLTVDEHRLINFDLEMNGQHEDVNALLLKSFDCWPNTAAPSGPCTVVRFLLNKPSSEQLETVVNTLIATLHDYDPIDNSAGFAAAHEFFKHCKDKRSCSHILRAAENETFNLTDKGGKPALAFWTAVSSITETDNALLSCFLDLVPRWAAALLAYEQSSVRDDTLTFLQDFLFKPLLSLLHAGDAKAVALAKHRHRVVLKTYGYCQTRFEQLINSNANRHRVQAIYDGLAECSDYIEQFQAHPESVKAWPEVEVDGKRLLGAFRRVDSTWIDYRGAEDAQSSATTDDSSDEEIDTPMTNHFLVEQQ